jgi:hypothetical protein
MFHAITAAIGVETLFKDTRCRRRVVENSLTVFPGIVTLAVAWDGCPGVPETSA